MGSPGFFTNHVLPHTEAYTNQLILTGATRPSGQYVGAVNTLISGLIADNNWYNLDRFWIFAAEQRAHAKVCIVNPTGLNQAWTGLNVSEVGTPSWAASGGYTSVSGTTSYINSNFTPSSGTPHNTATSAAIGCYDVTGTMSGLTYPAAHMGVFSSKFSKIIIHDSATVDYSTNDGSLGIGNGTGFSSGCTGLLVAQTWVKPSPGGLTQEGYYNATTPVATNLSPGSTGLPTASMYIGCINESGPAQFLNHQIALAFAGAAFTPDSQITGNGTTTGLSGRIATFATAIGF